MKRSIFGLVAMLSVVGTCHAQSFNIDLNIDFGPPSAGAGVPSSAFGAAADMPGFWNAVSGGDHSPIHLRGLDGVATNSRVEGFAGGSTFAVNNPINTGDYALLMNDGKKIDRILGFDFSIEGLDNGRYEVYTYTSSLTALTEVRRTRVTINQATGPISQIQTGPMPGNALVQGLTHTIHSSSVTQGRIDVRIDSLENVGQPHLCGIQIKQVVPEPGSLLPLASLVAPFLRSRRLKLDK